MKVLILIIALLPLHAKASDYMLIGSLTLHAVDWMQTRQIAKSSRYQEDNILLGHHPDVKAVNAYFILTGVILIQAHYLLPKRLRNTLHIFYMLNQTAFVLSNANIGVKIRF